MERLTPAELRFSAEMDQTWAACLDAAADDPEGFKDLVRKASEVRDTGTLAEGFDMSRRKIIGRLALMALSEVWRRLREKEGSR